MKCQNNPPHTIPRGVKYCALCGKPPRRNRLIPVLVILGVVVIGVGGFESIYHDRVYPRVQVVIPGGLIDTGGMTMQAAETALEPFSIKQRFRRVSLIAPGHATIRLPAYKLGYSIKGGVTTARAYAVGRKQSLLQSALEQLQALTQGARIALAQRVNQNTLRAYLFKLAPSMTRRPKLTSPGRRLDVVLSERDITRVLVKSGPSAVRLQFITIPRLVAARLAKPNRPK